MRAIQQKTLTRNPGSKVEWKETFRERSFRKFGYTSLGCPFFTGPTTCDPSFVQMNLANSCIIVGKKEINYIFL